MDQTQTPHRRPWSSFNHEKRYETAPKTGKLTIYRSPDFFIIVGPMGVLRTVPLFFCRLAHMFTITDPLPDTFNLGTYLGWDNTDDETERNALLYGLLVVGRYSYVLDSRFPQAWVCTRE